MTTTFHLGALPLAVRLGAPLAVAALVATACSSSGGSSGVAAAHTSVAAPAAGAHSSKGVAQVAAMSGPDGTYLTDAAGRSLYLYTPDKTSTSTCTGGCASAWPPLTSTGKPTAGSGATAADLGTSKRSDGSMQVTYQGHPLYYFSGDSKAGQTNGEGSEGIWFLVSPAGAKITGAAGAASSSDNGGSSGGY